MSKRYVPRRGDIVMTSFSPAVGHEQKGSRPALIVSPQAFNKHFGLALAAPITSRMRGHGFEVELNQGKTKGVVLCEQLKTIDYAERQVQFMEKASEETLAEVLARVAVLVR